MLSKLTILVNFFQKFLAFSLDFTKRGTILLIYPENRREQFPPVRARGERHREQKIRNILRRTAALLRISAGIGGDLHPEKHGTAGVLSVRSDGGFIRSSRESSEEERHFPSPAASTSRQGEGRSGLRIRHRGFPSPDDPAPWKTPLLPGSPPVSRKKRSSRHRDGERNLKRPVAFFCGCGRGIGGNMIPGPERETGIGANFPPGNTAGHHERL